MSKVRVGEDWREKQGTDPLDVEEDDRVEIEYKPPKRSTTLEKTATVDTVKQDDVAYLNVTGAGRWLLKHGAVEIVQTGQSNTYHGTLLDITRLDDSVGGESSE